MRAYGPITLRLHAVNDLVGLAFLLASPWLLGFDEHASATRCTVALVVIGMSLNFVTDYPLGIVRKLPFKWHKLVELMSPPLFIVAPWIFFADAGAMPWVTSILGLLVIVNAALTRASAEVTA
ncbi:MAG TPA: hypothetical protein VLD39_15845 [Gammaproteobacteria bacterium]|nr:hypothetical protein [Gammaproteobacteria bacterium]